MLHGEKKGQFWKVIQEIQQLKILIDRLWCRRHSSHILSNVRYIKVFTKHCVYFPVWLFNHHPLGILLRQNKQTWNYAPGVKHLHPKAQGHVLVLWKKREKMLCLRSYFNIHMSPVSMFLIQAKNNYRELTVCKYRFLERSPSYSSALGCFVQVFHGSCADQQSFCILTCTATVTVSCVGLIALSRMKILYLTVQQKNKYVHNFFFWPF